MKTRVFFAVIAMMCVLSASAQDENNGRRQRMNRAEMIQRQSERLVKELGLSDEKAETFKVLYLDYQTARQNAANPKGEEEARPDMNNLTDAQATDLVQKYFQTQEAQLKVDKEYYTKFIGILTPSQAVKVFVPQRSGFGQGQRRQGQGRQRGNGGFGGGRHGGNGGFGGEF